MNTPPLRIVAFEITRTCILSCRHCRGDSHGRTYENELGFNEIASIFDSISSFAKPIMIITGGEPLTRPDVFDIAARSTALGFRTTLATCGHLLDDDIASRLIDTGVLRISVSLDGASASTHDSFRGVPGAFDAALRGISAARRRGLPFQINSTITALNADEIQALHDLAIELGAEAFHPFLLVPVGRGTGLADAALSPGGYERVLEEIARLAMRSPLEIKPTCSPHYIRIAARIRKDGSSPPIADKPASPQGHGIHGGVRGGPAGGCLGGKGFVFISHRGKVQICGFLEQEAGDLRMSGYDMKLIWDTSPLFHEVRDTGLYGGACGICEYVRICGGCRARAYAEYGNYLGPEPNCTYEPKG